MAPFLVCSLPQGVKVTPEELYKTISMKSIFDCRERTTTNSSYLELIAELDKKVPAFTAAVKWPAASVGQARSKALFPS